MVATTMTVLSVVAATGAALSQWQHLPEGFAAAWEKCSSLAGASSPAPVMCSRCCKHIRSRNYPRHWQEHKELEDALAEEHEMRIDCPFRQCGSVVPMSKFPDHIEKHRLAQKALLTGNELEAAHAAAAAKNKNNVMLGNQPQKNGPRIRE